jgi:hypothetical protein
MIHHANVKKDAFDKIIITKMQRRIVKLAFK